MNLKQLEQDALSVANAILPLVVPGAGGDIVKAANAAISLVSDIKEDFSDPAKAAATETLAALQARVDAHVAATEQSLG